MTADEARNIVWEAMALLRDMPENEFPEIEEHIHLAYLRLDDAYVGLDRIIYNAQLSHED